jgi:predicted metal-dependent hydrolase
MSSRISLAELSAPLTLKPSPRVRTMRLRVDPVTGGVVLTFPRRLSQRRALEWAAGHTAWIEAQLARLPAKSAIEAGAVLPLYGLPHRIDWNAERSRVVKVEPGRLVAGGPLESLEARLMRWLKRHAQQVLEAETLEYAAKAGVSVTRVGVGDPRSRWGSCSSSGAIRYSWRLILAPEWVRRATVAHEVAHRVHMNHGPDFHALVETLLETNPGPARQWLRREGASIQRFGRL